MHIVHLFVCFLCLTVVYGQNPECNFQGPSSRGFPYIPPRSYRAEISGKDINGKFSIYARHTVDLKANKVAFYSEQQGNKITVVIDQTDKTVLTVDNQGCTLNSFSTTPQTRNGSDLLTFGDILNLKGRDNYVGSENIRGIPVDYWVKCVTTPGTNYMTIYDIYLTTDKWTMPSGLSPLPVRLIKRGKEGTGNNMKDVHYVLDLMNYEKYDTKEHVKDFDIPVGTYCPKIPAEKNPPQMPKSVSFQSETKFSSTSNVIISNKVTFDTTDQFSREDRTSRYFGGLTSVSYSTIRDFNEGIAYLIQTDGKCTSTVFNSVTKNLKNVSLPYLDDANVDDDGYYHMKTVEQMFHTNGKWNYHHQVNVRGIPCDMFERTYDVLGQTTQIRLYFATNTTENTEGYNNDVQDQIIRQETINPHSSSTEDIYDFIPDPTWSENPFDIRACYNESQKINFDLVFHGSYLASNKVHLFAREVRQKLKSVVGLGPSRIHWDEIFHKSGSIHFMGTLMDRGPDKTNFAQASDQIVDLSKLSAEARKSVVEYPKKDGLFTIHPESCAMICDGRQGNYKTIIDYKKCDSFDFCDGVCTFYSGHDQQDIKSAGYLKPQKGCTHYHKLVHIAPEPDLKEAWSKLRSAVYNNKITVSLKQSSYYTASLTAYAISDLNVELDDLSKSDSPLHDYLIIPNLNVYEGYTIGNTALTGCAESCTNFLGLECESFTYCSKLKECVLRETRPANKTVPKSDAGCNTFVRTYLADFERLPGKTYLSKNAAKTVPNAANTEDCARMCEKETGFRCESMDYCSDSGTCSLGKTHYFLAEEGAEQNQTDCVHFSRNYYFDYQKETGAVENPINAQVIEDISVEKCATMCSTDSKGCNTFLFCPGDKSCRIIDPSTQGLGQTSAALTGSCDRYTQKAGAFNGYSTLTEKEPYSAGEMGGLGVGILLLGILVAVIALVAVGRFRFMQSGGAVEGLKGFDNFSVTKDQLADGYDA